MANQKAIQSNINLVSAKLDQVKRSSHFTDEERAPLIAKLETELSKYALELEVVDAQIIQ